ncbi:hypothetical protein H5410_035295 [Solanum commersonii]|uniref:Craniofacial development protein 2-like n=1 Tax=Solanum commersonii TaxID=4109 RepID=A0A9J5Y2H3_SOLCO|nr:hypothetical protein H5410_035295 [Solanum commersonii]
MMMIMLVVDVLSLNVSSGSGRGGQKAFWEDLDEAMRDILNTEKIFIGGDFNGHIGVTSSGFANIQGAFDYGERNRGGACFRILLKSLRDKGLGKDCKVNPNENLTIQHNLLVMDLEIKRDKRKKTIYDRPMIRWGGLTLALSREMREKETTVEVLRESRGNFGGHQTDWWWNGEVQDKLEEKNVGYTKWEAYKTVKTKAILAVTVPKMTRERKARDLDQVKCIKDEKDNVLVEETSIKQRWQAYFHKILNEEEDKDIVLGELVHSEDCGTLGTKSTIKVRMEWFTRLFNVIFNTVKMSTNGGGVLRFHCEKIRVISKTVTIIGYQIAKTYCEGLGDTGGEKADSLYLRRCSMVYVICGGHSIIDKARDKVNDKLEAAGTWIIMPHIELGRLVSRVLCDKKIPHELKEIMMLIWMCRHIRRGKIKNEIIREKVIVASVTDKMKKVRLRCLSMCRGWASIPSKEVRQNSGKGLCIAMLINRYVFFHYFRLMLLGFDALESEDLRK